MITSEPTSWKCNEPTVRKWKVQNTWIKRLLIYNIHNIIGLGADILEIAKRLWNSLMDLYDRISEIAKLYVEEQLRSLHLCDGNDFPNHVTFLRQLWQKINSMGRTISNAIFRSILLGSLPSLLNSIVIMLYATILSIDVLIQLNVYWTQVSRCKRKNVNLATFSTVLQTSKPKYIVCANQWL